MNENLLQVQIAGKDGIMKTMEILFTFSCEELGKDYMAVTDWTYTENNELNIFVYSYEDGDHERTQLAPVTDPDELQMADDIIEEWKAVYEANSGQLGV